MAVWRCPHCATPQAESARCWVCHRSTTSCGTCRHFRRGVASGLGTCGLAPRRLALRGFEMRPCWTAPVANNEPPSIQLAGRSQPGGRDRDVRTRTFVLIDELALAREEPVAAPAASAAEAHHDGSLWGDVEG